MQALADVFGLPTAPSQINSQAMSITAAGVISISQAGATVAADPTTALGIASKQYVDTAGSASSVVTGTNDYTGTLSVAVASLPALKFRPLLIQPATTNTAAVTLNLSSLGAVSLVDIFGSQLQAGQLIAGITYSVIYDGTRYILQNPSRATYFGFATNANNYGVTLTPTPPSLAALQWVPLTIQSEGTNTGAVTLNFNSFGAVPLVSERGQPLVAGQFLQSSTYTVIYDGGSCLLQGESSQVIAVPNGGAVLTSPGMVQGMFVTVGGSATQTFNWPTAFPNGVFAAVTANQTSVTANPPTVLGFTSTTVQLHNPAAGNVITYVIAVGF